MGMASQHLHSKQLRDKIDGIRFEHRPADHPVDGHGGMTGRQIIHQIFKSGDRCWITRKAMPLSGGILSKNFSKADRPPAEAPIPTINAIE